MLPRLFALISLVLFAGCTATPQSQHGAQPESSLVGSYSFSSGTEPHDVALAVTVSRSGSSYTLALQAGHPDAHGAAPDGTGSGHVDASGVFRFTYEDSFSNRGSGSFRRTPKGYQLSIDIREVSDPRCMMFYGDFTLQRAKPK